MAFVKISNRIAAADIKADSCRLSAIAVKDGDLNGRTYVIGDTLMVRFTDGTKEPVTPEMAMRMEWDMPDDSGTTSSVTKDASTGTHPLIVLAMARMKASAETNAAKVINMEQAKAARIQELKQIGAAAGSAKSESEVPAAHAARVAELKALGQSVSR